MGALECAWPGGKEPVPSACISPPAQGPQLARGPFLLHGPRRPQSLPLSAWDKGPVQADPLGWPSSHLLPPVTIWGPLFTPESVPIGAISYLIALPTAG